ncbi:hypothetical protein MRX96_027212 [Rhipicephalus microplus]
MLSLSSAKHDSHLHKTKHSEPIHDSTGVKEMGNVGRQLHAINTSLHLVKRKTVTDTDISSKQTSASRREWPFKDPSRAAPPANAGNDASGNAASSFACAVLILATLLGVIAYMLLFSKLTTSTESCETKPCSDLAARLLDSMDTGLDPCNDFYSFVCAHAHVRSVRDDMNAIATQGQFAELSRDLWRVHKPSRLYHRCLEPEPSERAANILALKAILRNLSLHWPEDQQHPSDRHPMDVMLEMAIKWDINFLFSLEVADSQATGKVLVFRKPRIVAAWVDRLEYTAGSIEYARHVQTHLTVLNASSSVKYSTLMKLERSFTQVLLGASNQQSWMTLSKFDSIAASLGKNALLNLTCGHSSAKPALMFREDIEEKKKRACLEYVDSRLGLLSSAEYETQLFPSHDTRHDVSNFLLSVTNEFKSLAKNASWMDRESRETVQLKIDSVTLNVMPAEEFFQSQQRESMYEIFPPMNGSVFFDDWLRASRVFQSLQGHDHFRDVYSKRRTSLGPEPFSYNYLLNLVDAAMVALEPPIYYVGAPFAINYAGLGSLFAREVARSFDSRGTTVDNRGENVHWWGSAQSIDYNHRVSCDLGQNTTIAFMPAIPALEASYSAYQTAVYHAAARIGARKDIKIRRLESYSEDQIFFMTYCYSLCDRKRAATRREECNVPLSHFSEFAKAFRCIRGAPMNALKKCKFF